MPYCPKCEFEYREGLIRCPECDVPLVEALAPKGPSHPAPETELVELCRGIEPGEAEMIREALQQAGIACSVKTYGPITGYFLATVVDGATHDYCTLLVTRNRLAEAEQVLEAARSARIEWPEGLEPEDE